MENRKSIKLILIMFTGVLFFNIPIISYAYSVSTHNNITKTTFGVYEQLYGETFTNEEVNLAAIGSEEEDTFESKRRPLNHFYDPISGEGLRVFWLNINNITSGIASPIWAEDTKKQANFLKTRVKYNDKYFSSPTDFSWDRAVYEYVHGDKDRAIETLGHILHLIEDATVPAHVSYPFGV